MRNYISGQHGCVTRRIPIADITDINIFERDGRELAYVRWDGASGPHGIDAEGAIVTLDALLSTGVGTGPRIGVEEGPPLRLSR